MATSINPYAAFLQNADVSEVLAATPGRLSELLNKWGPEGEGRMYAPGKWSAREILCHLADTEIAFAFRLRQTLAEPQHVIQPFDQAMWAKPYAKLDARAAVDTFAALRKWNLALIEAAGEGALTKRVSHPERGEMTFQTILETMAGHDRNHLRQLETIAGEGR